MTPNDATRRRMLYRLLEQSRMDSLVVGRPADWYYLTGFTGESGALIVSRNRSTLLTDGRFTVQAKQETKGIRVAVQRGNLFQAAGEYLKAQGFRRVGFEPEQLTVAGWSELRRAARGRYTTIPASGFVSGLRTRKDATELTQMRKAALLASAVVQSAMKLLKPGVREREVASEIEYEMMQRGASSPAFETIVAFGERSALPHARPTAKRLRKNELVVLDLGVILGHYCSDITRTVFVGKAPERIRRWYRGVQEAQAAAIAAARDGVACGEVDGAARKVLASYKLDQFFVHSTGHGLGLEVHEEPRVAKGLKRRLQAGNVITIEPGVYVEGVGGIRIEDDVAIHEKQTEVLTRGSRELIEL